MIINLNNIEHFKALKDEGIIMKCIECFKPIKLGSKIHRVLGLNSKRCLICENCSEIWYSSLKILDNPMPILKDTPTSNSLDLIKKFRQNMSINIIYTTHDINQKNKI